MLCEVRKMNWSSGKNWQRVARGLGGRGVGGAESIEIHLMKKLGEVALEKEQKTLSLKRGRSN